MYKKDMTHTSVADSTLLQGPICQPHPTTALNHPISLPLPSLCQTYLLQLVSVQPLLNVGMLQNSCCHGWPLHYHKMLYDTFVTIYTSGTSVPLAQVVIRIGP